MGFGINSRLTTFTHITDTVIGAIFTNLAAFVELSLVMMPNALTEPHLTEKCVMDTPNRLNGS